MPKVKNHLAGVLITLIAYKLIKKARKRGQGDRDYDSEYDDEEYEEERRSRSRRPKSIRSYKSY